MKKAQRVSMGAAIGVAGLLAVGVPLVAQPGGGPGSQGPPDHARGGPGSQGPPDHAAGSASPERRATLFAGLLGKNEVSVETQRRRAGDLDGQGGATVTFKGTQLCWAVAVRGIAGVPTGLHVHEGRSNVNGAIVVELTPPSGGDPGASAGCLAVDQGLADRIQRHPRRFYVNIHNEEFPAGALRGQLHGVPRGS